METGLAAWQLGLQPLQRGGRDRAGLGAKRQLAQAHDERAG
jgi:hypothetical protein